MKEAAALGVPDAYRGETVKVGIVPQDGAGLTAADIEAHCRGLAGGSRGSQDDRVPGPKYPPKSAVGKVLRRELKEAGAGPLGPQIFVPMALRRAPLPLAEFPTPGGPPQTCLGRWPWGCSSAYATIPSIW